jgi:hypothetical protein
MKSEYRRARRSTVVAVIEAMEPRQLLSNFVVTTAAASGPGSLAQAMADANASADPSNLITFNIPGTGAQTIKANNGLPQILTNTTIDATTQPGYAGTPLIALTHDPGQGNYDGFNAWGGSLTLRGFSIYGFSVGVYLGSPNCVVAGNYIGLDPTGNRNGNNTGVAAWVPGYRIGGTTAAERNVISGNTQALDLYTSGTVEGNYIGTDPTGTRAIGNGRAIYLTAIDNHPNPFPATIGGLAPGAGNLISGNYHNGIVIDQAAARNGGPGSTAVIQGNWIGVDSTGSTALRNMGHGIFVNAYNVLVGGTAAGARNVISGNRGDGIYALVGYRLPAASPTIQGNYIGTDSTGTKALGNGASGVDVYYSGGATIGGLASGAGNRIAYNGKDGIVVLGLKNPDGSPGSFSSQVVRSNRISANNIWGNHSLGIDLNDDGVTPNDPSDADIGPNDLQNYPVITAVTVASGKTTVTGTLDSRPNGTYRIELFSSVDPAPGLYGAGQSFIGYTDVKTDANGHATFSVTMSFVVPAGRVVSSTATDSIGNTSEFSADLRVPGASPANKPPGLGGLLFNAAAIARGTPSVSITAAGVTDLDGPGQIASVTFFAESNGVAGLQTGVGGDTPIGTDANGADGWSVVANTTNLPAGLYTYYAQVTDTAGRVSSAASKILPVVVPTYATGTVRYDITDLASNTNEPGLAGVTVFADINGDGQYEAGEPSTTSDASGHYAVPLLLPYINGQIQQILPAGYVQEASYTYYDGNVGAYVHDFFDTNVSGVYGTVSHVTGKATTPLPDVRVYVDANGNNQFDPGEISAVTREDLTGYYELPQGLPAGTYTIRVDLPAGLILADPSFASKQITVTGPNRVTQVNFILK